MRRHCCTKSLEYLYTHYGNSTVSFAVELAQLTGQPADINAVTLYALSGEGQKGAGCWLR